tara:strand:+ start:225 stop:620 length:396 start_codon:yes stop_codon:yes gene_type:complete
MFKTITIYNKKTGVIIRNVYGAEDVTNNVQAGEDYIEGNYSTDFYKVVDGIVEEKSTELLVEQNKKQAQIDLRNYRGAMLDSTDWTQVVDNPLTEAKKLEWQTYRQALRDLPTAYTDIESVDEVIFPKEPE